MLLEDYIISKTKDKEVINAIKLALKGITLKQAKDLIRISILEIERETKV
jgi:hypothetical protein